MMQDGFCVVAFEDNDFNTIESIITRIPFFYLSHLMIVDMYDVGLKFLSQDKEQKNVHLDPKNENLGYIDVEGLRDFIKVPFFTIFNHYLSFVLIYLFSFEMRATDKLNFRLILLNSKMFSTNAMTYLLNLHGSF